MGDWSEKLSFREFSDFCEASVKEKKKDKRLKIIEKFMTSCQLSDGSQIFLERPGTSHPGIYREQGLWNHLSKILGRQGTEYIVYREQGFQKCGIVDKRK